MARASRRSRTASNPCAPRSIALTKFLVTPASAASSSWDRSCSTRHTRIRLPTARRYAVSTLLLCTMSD